MAKFFRGILVLMLSICVCHTAKARIDVRETQPLILPKDPSEPVLSAETSKKILPKKIEPGESGNSVISEMVDNSFSTWWDQSAVKESGVGKVADDIDKKLKTEVNLGKSADSQTEHKISVKVLAAQALAKIEYQGWVKAGVNYDARAAKTEAQVTDNLAKNQDLVVSHSITSTENASQLSLVWNW
jgi:hypothetical protein